MGDSRESNECEYAGFLYALALREGSGKQYAMNRRRRRAFERKMGMTTLGGNSGFGE